jgi:PAS domain S-box-containing protein
MNLPEGIDSQQDREIWQLVSETPGLLSEFFDVYAEPAYILSLEDRRLLALNRAFERETGWTRDQWLGRSYLEVLHPDDRAQALALTARTLAGEDVPPFELRVLTPDGDWLTGQFSVMPVRRDGRIVAELGLVHNITPSKRQAEELRRRDATLHAISRSAAQLLGARHWQEGIDPLLADLGQSAEVDRVYIFEKYVDAAGVQLISQTHEWAREGVSAQIDNPKLQGILVESPEFARWWDVLGHGESVYGPVSEFPPAEQSILTEQGIRSVAIVPLLADSEWLGLLGFDSCYSLRLWSAAELDVLRTTADLIAAAMQRERREEEERLQRSLAEALLESAAVLNSTLSFEEILDRILEAIGRVVPHDAANVMLVEGEGLRLARARGYQPDRNRMAPASFFERIENVPNFERMFATGLPVVVPDTAKTGAWVEVAEAAWVHSYAGIPIRDGERVIGFLNLDSQEPYALTERWVGALQGFAGLMSMAVRNARLYEQAERRAEQLESLHRIDRAINASFDLGLTLQVFLQELGARVGARAAAVWRFDEQAGTLELAGNLGLKNQAGDLRQMGTSERAIAQVTRTKRGVFVADLDATMRASVERDFGEELRAYAAVPLVTKGSLEGVLEVLWHDASDCGQETLGFLEGIAQQGAIALSNYALFEELSRANVELSAAYDATIEALSQALDLRDRDTEGHTQRVAEIAVRLARRLGLRGEALHNLRWGALLHDIGKLAVPDAILLKPGPLTEEEWQVMHQHPALAGRLLAPIDYLRAAAEVPLNHHERWDGSGYPRGLKREEIPLSARLFAVVDVYDALRSDRPYREAWPEGAVRQYLREQSGKLFDPRVVESFLQMIAGEEGEPAAGL